MDIESDTFSVSWAVSYRSKLNFCTQLVVECYGSSAYAGQHSGVVAMRDLKGIAEIEIKRGEAFIEPRCWQLVILVGEDNMRNLLRNIFEEEVHLDEDSIEMAFERFDDSLEESLFSTVSDPSLN